MRKASFLFLSIFTALILLSYSNALWNDNLIIKSSINTGQWLLENNLPEVSQDGLSNGGLAMEPAVLDTDDPSTALEKPAAKQPDEEKAALDIIETEESDSQKSGAQKDVDSVDDSATVSEESVADDTKEAVTTYDIAELTHGENVNNNFFEEKETVEESNLEGDTVDHTKDEMGDKMKKDPLDDADSNERPNLEDLEKNNEIGEGVK